MDFIENSDSQHILKEPVIDGLAMAVRMGIIIFWRGIKAFSWGFRYIPTRRYDGLSANNIVWLALWKVRDDYKSSMVGLKLLKKLSL